MYGRLVRCSLTNSPLQLRDPKLERHSITEDLNKIRVGTLELAYRVAGRGTPLLLLHGQGGDHQIYDELQDALGDEIASVSFDQRDCGSSKWTASPPQSYTLHDIASDAVGLMDALGHRRFHLFGGSLGGLLAQHLAYHWPDRVDCLILAFTWPAHSRLMDLYPHGVRRLRELSALGSAGDPMVAELMSSRAYVETNPQVIQRLAAMTSAASRQAQLRRRAAVDSAAPIDPKSILVRTLAIGAESDQLVPPAVVQSLSEAIPGSTFVTIKGVGHLAAIESPDRLAAMIRDFIRARR